MPETRKRKETEVDNGDDDGSFCCGDVWLRDDVEEVEEGGAVLFLVSGELGDKHGGGGGR